ncbi:hypothetical protein BR93DRAFT_937258 [Coniochaeta sp. PMI_546]|nr:hypothetical protein BR93DRAFT_937258 [Coniochaeta sp. PMI_546]
MATKRSTTHPDRTSDSPEHEPDPQRPQLDIPSHHQGIYGVVAITEGMTSLGLQSTAGALSSGGLSYWSDEQVLEAERELFSDISGSHVAHFQHLSGDHQQAGASGYQHLYGNYQQGQGSGYQQHYGNYQQGQGSGYQQHYGNYQQGQGSGYQHLYVGPGQVYGYLPSQQGNANPLEIAGPSSTPGIAASTQLSLGAASAGGSRANPGQNGESSLMAPVPDLQDMDPAHSEGDTVEI